MQGTLSFGSGVSGGSIGCYTKRSVVVTLRIGVGDNILGFSTGIGGIGGFFDRLLNLT